MGSNVLQVSHAVSAVEWLRRRLQRGHTSRTGRIALFLLLILSVGAIGWDDKILGRTIAVDPDSAALGRHWHSDRDMGGRSVVAGSSERMTVACRLAEGYQHPYCGNELLLAGLGSSRGADLSRFDSLTLRLNYKGPARSLRLHLKNHNARYVEAGARISTKFNKIEFEVRQGWQTVVLAREDFSVADWWLEENKVPPHLAKPEFGNVTSLEMMTGTGAPLGNHEITLDGAHVQTRLLSRAEWHLGLLGAWVVLILGYLLARAARSERAIGDLENFNRSTVNAIPDCICLFDLEGRRLFANDAAVRAEHADPRLNFSSGVLAELALPVRLKALLSLARARRGTPGRLLILAGGGRWWDIVVAPSMNGRGEVRGLIVVARDVSEQKAAEEQARWSANHDLLTGLPNRVLLQKRLDDAIISAATSGERFALLLLDIDDFKRINDTAGHDAGDALLKTFAQRLAASIRADDMAARLGGDEFAVLLRSVGSERDLRTVVRGLMERLSEPSVYKGRLFDSQGSIGASFYPRDGSNRPQLLKNADVALYEAKALGKGNFQIFRPAMRVEMQKRACMIRVARDALRQGRVVPHYQPIVSLASGRICGFEALLRWRHPRNGMQPPALIAAAFEDLSIACDISDRMIEAVLADICVWRERGLPFGHVAVNASAADFRREDFADTVLERLSRAGLPPSTLQIEVTETVFLGRGAELVSKALSTLSAAGVKVSLDDFGTGYASLSHLKQFPVDTIKIDRNFVREVTAEEIAAPIADAVIQLGKSLGMQVVAEGVETEAQHRYLARRGCDFAQGYLYSPAVASAEAQNLLLAAAELRAAA